jgi:two-component system, OmpR family, response regulator
LLKQLRLSHRILFVDDDRTFVPITQEYLASKGLDVVLFHLADEGLAAFKQQPFDLCILDIRMPFKDGFALAMEIRQIDPNQPILFLTSQTSKEDRIAGLQFGADDYVTKPFSVEELYLRVMAILRRTSNQGSTKQASEGYTVGSYVYRANTRQLEGPNGMIRLSSIEDRLLTMFSQHPDGILDRETALRRIWSDEHQLHGRSLNVYVSKLRGYFKDDARIEILNIHGTGYRLVVHPDPQ